tara:strand:- start:68 stop:352 length:285 start_codon:yes stop_codon:yes gene_type:complete
MKQEIVKYMIDNEFIKKNSLINATIRVHGLGGQPVILEKNILFEEWAESTKGALYIKGCDPENLKNYVVSSTKIHEINGMDQPTIRRLFPEMNL